jgi:hypothetical protein
VPLGLAPGVSSVLTRGRGDGLLALAASGVWGVSGAAAGEACGARWYFPFVFVALEGGGACWAEGQAAVAVAPGVALPAAGARADGAGAGIADGTVTGRSVADAAVQLRR